MRKSILIMFLIMLPVCSYAVVRHSTETQTEYKKWHALALKNPTNTVYLFEEAMVLAYMGKIEIAGERLRRIDQIDDKFASKILMRLEVAHTRSAQDWKINFKLGFVYYYLFEEAIGRMELAKRRIKKARQNPKEYSRDTIPNEKALIEEKKYLANSYRNKANTAFNFVAHKKPQDAINAWGYAYQAVIHAVDKEWPEAKENCEEALGIAPDAYAIRAAYMEALKQTGDYFGSTSQMATALRLKSEQDAYEKELFGEEIK